ncbi:MAG: hypothetical protein D6719_01500 [Candidatus Dadabacteria bacterium]|nr:MAG: hypothetical protein D6719_01500 [Candidatus Dadabacteria bacterium]
MYSGDPKSKKDLRERAFEKLDLRAELDLLERMIAELKVDYEQYFLGIVPFSPDKQHSAVKRKIRELVNAPFKNSQMNFRLRTLESRYQTYNNYWQRVLREREEGTYSRDVFKANLRERRALEVARENTKVGKADKSMRTLYDNYRRALEKQTGRKQDIDFNAFKKSLIKRAKSYREKHGNKKLVFKVAVKDGKVTIRAKAKD